MKVLKRVIDAVRHKLRELWRDRSLILHHGNVPRYFLLQKLQFLAGKGISMDHLYNSPYLAPANFLLFPKQKSRLKGKHFLDVEDTKSGIKILTHILVQDFKNCFEQWPKHWAHCKEREEDDDNNNNNNNNNSLALVRERIILTERPPLIGAADSHGRILGFLDRNGGRLLFYFFFTFESCILLRSYLTDSFTTPSIITKFQ
jgi:hypothetical protein